MDEIISGDLFSQKVIFLNVELHVSQKHLDTNMTKMILIRGPLCLE